MGKIVVKRFPDDKLFGAGTAAIARWANKHNARVISQSASNGWLIVTFELLDEGSSESSSMFVPQSLTTTVRQATVEELREMAKADSRLKAQERNVTITYLEDSEEDESARPKKKRWWKR